MPVLPTEETISLTQRAALVVSSRYHPLVFATAAAIPCLGIHRDAYTRIKLQGALAHVGMEVWSLPASAAGEGELAAALERLWNGREKARRRWPGRGKPSRSRKSCAGGACWTGSAARGKPERPSLWAGRRNRWQRRRSPHSRWIARPCEETARWRGIVRYLERSVELAAESFDGRKSERSAERKGIRC